MRLRNTFALKITVGCKCACLSANNNTQAENKVDTKTTNIGCATEFTSVPQLVS